MLLIGIHHPFILNVEVFLGHFEYLECYSCAGQLVWRRHTSLPPPSPQVVRNTCMQLLPIVEMYCKWELEEDCADLRALVLRFYSEEELGSHELGRSLLCMVRDNKDGLDRFPMHEPTILRANPFDGIRQRLAAVDVAIHGLQSKVRVRCGLFALCIQGCKLKSTPISLSHTQRFCLCHSTTCAIFKLHIYMWQQKQFVDLSRMQVNMPQPYAG